MADVSTTNYSGLNMVQRFHAQTDLESIFPNNYMNDKISAKEDDLLTNTIQEMENFPQRIHSIGMLD